LQLLLGFDDTLPIVRIDDEDQALSILKVVPPQRADLVLTTDVPYRETDVFVFHGFNVETCGNGDASLKAHLG
jgi:hypothetical protein